jgi:hypothetical protein
LCELRTDHIDLFLLHEANLEDAKTPGLLDFLETAKRSGKIRAFGSASDCPATLEIITHAPGCASIIQIANGFGQWNLRRLPPESARFVVTHGALKILPLLENALLRAGSVPDETDSQFFISARGSDLAGLLLGLAIHENPQGITLFSSTHPQRIRDNITKTRETNSFSAADWSAFRRVAEQSLAAFDVC